MSHHSSSMSVLRSVCRGLALQDALDFCQDNLMQTLEAWLRLRHASSRYTRVCRHESMHHARSICRHASCVKKMLCKVGDATRVSTMCLADRWLVHSVNAWGACMNQAWDWPIIAISASFAGSSLHACHLQDDMKPACSLHEQDTHQGTPRV